MGGGGGWSSVLSQKCNEICTRAYVKRLKELGDQINQNSDSGNCCELSETLKKKKGKRSKVKITQKTQKHARMDQLEED